MAIEGARRLAGFGRDIAFFIPDDQPGHVRTNPNYTALFLPARGGKGIARRWHGSQSVARRSG